MPLGYEIDPQRGRAVARGSGPMTMGDMVGLIERLGADPAFRPEFRVVFDLRTVSYEAETRDADDLASVLALRKTRFEGNFAVVVSESLGLMAKLYCMLANAAGFLRIRSFTDMAEAEAWCDRAT